MNNFGRILWNLPNDLKQLFRKFEKTYKQNMVT